MKRSSGGTIAIATGSLMLGSWILITTGTSLADDGDLSSADRAWKSSASTQDQDAQALSALIDRHIADAWEASGVEPAEPADDAEYLRRVSLDINGKIPTAAEARLFLDDPRPSAEKRRELVHRLLQGPGYANRFSGIWKDLLLPEAGSNLAVRFSGGAVETWLRNQFADDVPYDQLVRELLTVNLVDPNNRRRVVNPFDQREQVSPIGFYLAKEGKPENLAASSAKLFLGLRLECAQCHDHPFAAWKRDEFWSLAAFFAGLESPNANGDFVQIREVADRREIGIEGTDRVVQAAFLDGSAPRWSSKESPRATLADWMTSPENPYFARATVNRVWSLFFGIGLVDPVDDMDIDNPASHPELLDELADSFASSGFNLKTLVRGIVGSQAYNLSSAGEPSSLDDPQLFARMPLRALSPQQLYESFVQATGISRERDPGPGVISNGPRQDFLERFERPRDENPIDHQTSILQALTLMNGQLTSLAIDSNSGRAFSAVADSYFLTTEEKVEALYFSALTRPPRPEELDRLVPYVDRGGPTLDPKKALADVFWSLINSAEFVLNH